jgi:hypothetical protein
MADLAEFYVWNSGNAVFADVGMAEEAIQPGDFLMVNVIEADRLIDRFTPQNREERKNKRFRRNSKTMPCNGDNEKDQDNRDKTDNLLHSLYLIPSRRICQFNSTTGASSIQNRELSKLSRERSEMTTTA